MALMASGVLDSSLAFHIGEARKNGVIKEEMSDFLTMVRTGSEMNGDAKIRITLKHSLNIMIFNNFTYLKISGK